MRILSIFLVLAAFAAPAVAAPSPATRAVRSANQQISRLLALEVEAGSDKERAVAGQVTESVREFLDVGELGRLALTDHWAKLSEAQRTEYLSLLRELVEKNYVKGLRANLAYEVDYTGESQQGDKVVVATEIKTRRKGRPVRISVEYALARQDGKWRAFDVITDGVGLVENYRAQFNRIIDKEGFDGLLSRMRKKRDAMK